MNYWLMKSEPDTFSIDDLQQRGTEPWDGVRNYQARNFMRDEMHVGDLVLFYHSNAKPPGVAGIGKVASKAYPDPTQFDSTSTYYDPKSTKENPRWWLVDIAFVAKFKEFVPLDALKTNGALKDMKVVQRGQRLSVQLVTKDEFAIVKAMGG